MAEKSAFFNAQLDASTSTYDRTYAAEDFAEYFSRFISNGVFPNPSTGLQVVAANNPNMTVVLNIGYAYINGYTYENTEKLTFSIDVADGVLSRRDAIFIRYDLANRCIKAYKAKGTASPTPVAPTPLRTGDYWDLCVAIIHVDNGVTKIEQSLIEDTRLDTNLCGIVHGLVTQVDTTTLYNQIQTDLNNFQTISEARFNAWFADINSKLGTAPATNLQNQINTLDSKNKQTDVFDAMTHLYSGKFLLNAWTQDGNAWTQTVALVKETDGPNVTTNSHFMSGPMHRSTGIQATDEILRDNLNIINEGSGKLGDNKITVKVWERPSADITVYWAIKENI